MPIPRYLLTKIYQAAVLISGVFIGVNNYDIISSVKERINNSIQVTRPNEEQLTILEELVKLKENETNNLYRASNR